MVTVGQPNTRTARLRDLADQAGVSVPTASRALSRPDMVAPATRDRVLEAAELLNYRHHPSARALITGRTGLVGLSVPTLASPFFGLVISGAQQAAEAAGYSLLVLITEGSPERELTSLSRVEDQVDGLICASPSASDADLATLGERKPLVLVNRRAPGVSSVLVDTPDGAAQLAEHLAGLGHSRIMYLSGPQGSWMDPRRCNAMARVLHGHGADLDVLGPLPLTYASGSGSVHQVLDSEATAVVVYNSVLLLGLYQALVSQAVRTPTDLSLACVDDLAGVGLAMPQVTSVHVPAHEVGRLALEHLTHTQPGQRTKQTTVPVHLRVGESTGPPRRHRPFSSPKGAV